MITPIILFNTRFTIGTRFRGFFDRFLGRCFFFFPACCAGNAVVVLFASFAYMPGSLVVDALAEGAGCAGEYWAGGGRNMGVARVAGGGDAPVKIWIGVYDGAG